MKLDESSLTPLYQQVMEEIKEAIADGRYPAGSKIPSEPELSEMYSVSRITVRRAVEELVNQGLLTKRQGKGTYVTQRKILRKIEQESNVQSFTDACLANGYKPGAQIVARETVPSSPEAQSFLGLGEDDELILISRVRTADGQPIMFENNYFPSERFAFLLEENLEDVSIFDVIEHRLGERPVDSEPCTIEIVLATSTTAGPLGVGVGEPLFFENVHFLDGEGKPYFFGHQYIVGSRYSFVI